MLFQTKQTPFSNFIAIPGFIECGLNQRIVDANLQQPVANHLFHHFQRGTAGECWGHFYKNGILIANLYLGNNSHINHG